MEAGSLTWLTFAFRCGLSPVSRCLLQAESSWALLSFKRAQAWNRPGWEHSTHSHQPRGLWSSLRQQFKPAKPEGTLEVELVSASVLQGADQFPWAHG